MGRSLPLKRAGLIGNLGEIPDRPTTGEEGQNVSPRGYPATTAFSSLNLGIGGIG